MAGKEKDKREVSTPRKGDQLELSNRPGDSLADHLRRNYLGRDISMLCVRFWYRGILVEVGKDYAVLAQPRCVSNAGFSADATPREEDIIPSDLVVATGAIEMVCLPSWVRHDMPTLGEPNIKLADGLVPTEGTVEIMEAGPAPANKA